MFAMKGLWGLVMWVELAAAWPRFLSYRAAASCAIRGYDLGSSLLESHALSLSLCSSKCTANSACKSFGHNANSNQCLIFWKYV